MFDSQIILDENTLGLRINEDEFALTKENINSVIDKCSDKREWFTDTLSSSKSLITGNALGFVIGSHYDIKAEWDGTPQSESILIQAKASEEEMSYMSPTITSEKGNGILTFTYPFSFKTPKGVKLITINPPNMILPGMTVLTEVFEPDTEEENFSFNIKFNVPGIGVELKAGTPLVAVVPINELCVRSFNLKVFEQ
jgi:hypothetical protein